MKKIIVNGQMRHKPYSTVIYRSSLVKASMNAVRAFKLRNGVNKMLQFLLFSKTEQRPYGTCQLRRNLVFEA
jgi:hypothetical protein